ncbi:hypothetical protein E4V82_22575 [Clostridium estertheticum]|uniref:Uncharacterized protein n=1 Tax=Clostridium estertheticum TaxID=238834 RepID=A0A5N7J809_9CLOT|nr:hypothetical protein [Clostridium estertheticum]
MNSNRKISHWFDILLLDKSSYNKVIVGSTNERLIRYTGISQISEKIYLENTLYLLVTNPIMEKALAH